MKILVCGAGDVGWHAVERLLRLGEHELAVLDTDRSRLENLANQFDVSYFVGSCTLPSSYEELRIKDFDLLVAATARDEANLIASDLASTMHRKRGGPDRPPCGPSSASTTNGSCVKRRTFDRSFKPPTCCVPKKSPSGRSSANSAIRGRSDWNRAREAWSPCSRSNSRTPPRWDKSSEILNFRVALEWWRSAGLENPSFPVPEPN